MPEVSNEKADAEPNLAFTVASHLALLALAGISAFYCGLTDVANLNPARGLLVAIFPYVLLVTSRAAEEALRGVGPG